MAEQKVEDNNTKAVAAAILAAEATGFFSSERGIEYESIPVGLKTIGKVQVRKRGEMLRTVSASTGRLIKNKNGTPVDGGGFAVNDPEQVRRALWQGKEVATHADRLRS